MIAFNEWPAELHKIKTYFVSGFLWYRQASEAAASFLVISPGDLNFSSPNISSIGSSSAITGAQKGPSLAYKITC
jgi:hypothetical protein